MDETSTLLTCRTFGFHPFESDSSRQVGRVGEWFMPAVLKTAAPKGSVGSNPTSSTSCATYDRAHGHRSVKAALFRAWGVGASHVAPVLCYTNFIPWQRGNTYATKSSFTFCAKDFYGEALGNLRFHLIMRLRNKCEATNE